MLTKCRDNVLLKKMDEVIYEMKSLSLKYAEQPILSKINGSPLIYYDR